MRYRYWLTLRPAMPGTVPTKNIDDGVLLGWYFCKEGCCWGDGTKKMAERIEKEMAEDGR